MKSYKSLVIILIVATISACKKDPDPVVKPPPLFNDSEIITTVKITLKDSAGISSDIVASFNDADGPGGNSPSPTDTIRLQSGKTYYGTLLLLNTTASPTDTISNEVYEERNDHIFFYKPDGAAVTIAVTDFDDNNLPLGLKSRWRTGQTGTGTVKIILKHQPDQKNGTEAPGETDIDVTFPVKIQ